MFKSRCRRFDQFLRALVRNFSLFVKLSCQGNSDLISSHFINKARNSRSSRLQCFFFLSNKIVYLFNVEILESIIDQRSITHVFFRLSLLVCIPFQKQQAAFVKNTCFYRMFIVLSFLILDLFSVASKSTIACYVAFLNIGRLATTPIKNPILTKRSVSV